MIEYSSLVSRQLLSSTHSLFYSSFVDEIYRFFTKCKLRSLMLHDPLYQIIKIYLYAMYLFKFVSTINNWILTRGILIADLKNLFTNERRDLARWSRRRTELRRPNDSQGSVRPYEKVRTYFRCVHDER